MLYIARSERDVKYPLIRTVSAFEILLKKYDRT